ncbi:MAG: exodeoxyribonuclease VII small subunit [Actinomycetes bacterium]
MPQDPPAPQQPGSESLTYEQARDELATVVAELEAGTSTLEQSLALWERGETLVAICQQWLDNARTRIEAVRRQADSGQSQADTSA